MAPPLPQLEVKKLKLKAARSVSTGLVKQPPNFDSEKLPVHLPSAFRKQMDQARIPSFDWESVQLPRAHSSLNDEVKLGAFQPADISLMGNSVREPRELRVLQVNAGPRSACP